MMTSFCPKAVTATKIEKSKKPARKYDRFAAMIPSLGSEHPNAVAAA
jgi:hypothetical protein